MMQIIAVISSFSSPDFHHNPTFHNDSTTPIPLLGHMEHRDCGPKEVPRTVTETGIRLTGPNRTGLPGHHVIRIFNAPDLIPRPDRRSIRPTNHKVNNGATGRFQRMKGIMTLLPALMITALALLVIGLDTVSGEDPGVIGADGDTMMSDLIVPEGTTLTLSGETWEMNGNIVVRGTLVLEGTTMVMTPSYNGQFGIHVAPGGYLIMTEGSVIRSNTDIAYTFRVTGDGIEHGRLDILGSTVLRAGYPSTHPDRSGIHIHGGLAKLERATIGDSYHGLIITEANEGAVGVHDSEFHGHEQGLTLTDTSGITLTGNNFTGNGCGLVVSRSSDITISFNTFTMNDRAMAMDNSTGFHMEGNILSGNRLSGISVEHSWTGIIAGNTISWTRSPNPLHSGTGFIIRSSSGIVARDNAFEFNTIGVMLLHNASGIELTRSSIRGGRIGLFLYDLHQGSTIANLTIAETREAAIHVIHSTGQRIESPLLAGNRGRELNITASRVDIFDLRRDRFTFSADETSTVRLWSRTRVKVGQPDGTPLSGSDLLIVNEGVTLHRSPGYGGSDPVTDGSGLSGTILYNYGTAHHHTMIPGTTEIRVMWGGLELFRSLSGELREMEPLSLGVPDLTVLGRDIAVDPSEPRVHERSVVSFPVTNIGSAAANSLMSVYSVPGSQQPDAETPVHGFPLPTEARLVDRIWMTVGIRDRMTVTVNWTPDRTGVHTIIVIIDENSEHTELRRDNNIAMAWITVTEQTDPAHKAVMVLDLPGNPHGTTIRSSYIFLTPSIRNDGQAAGTVLFRVLLVLPGDGENSTHGDGISPGNGDPNPGLTVGSMSWLEMIQLYRLPLTVEPGQSRSMEVRVDLVPGDVTLVLTMFREGGGDGVEIVTPELTVTFVAEQPPVYHSGGDRGPRIPMAVLFPALAGLLSFVIAFLTFAESCRYRVLLFLAPLYMRMSKKDITEHYTRGEILGYIKQNPGESYNNIKRDLDMSNGKLAYHLSVLERGGFIKSVTDGMYRRYYPKKMKVSTYGRITSVQEEILRRIEETPGITQKDLSNIVNLSTATINYHIRKLNEKGLITTKRSGIFIHYYLAGELSVEEIMADAISSSGRG